MVQINCSSDDTAPALQDSTLRQFLQRQANVQLSEVHSKSINEWIQLSNEYLRDFEEALLRNDQEDAYTKFVVASRISYVVIPAHPRYANITKPEKVNDDLLRKKILENFTGFMSLTVPSILEREIRYLHVASPSNRRPDRLTPPASPVSSVIASIENDRQSVISSDSFPYKHQNNLAEQSFTADWESIQSGPRPPPFEYSPHHYNPQHRRSDEQIMPLDGPVVMDDNHVIASGVNLFGDLEHRSSFHSNEASNSEPPITGSPQYNMNQRVIHGRHQSASDTMAELFEQINEQMRNPYRNNHDASSISSDDDVDQEEPQNNDESPNFFASNGNRPFPRVGFRNEDPSDTLLPNQYNHSVHSYVADQAARLSDEKIPTVAPTTASSPNSEIFPMDSISRASSISQHGGLIAKSEEHLATEFDHLRLTTTNSMHVLQPSESITLIPQKDDDIFNKPDENDGSRFTDATTTQKPDDVLPSDKSIMSTTSSKAHSDSSDSNHTKRRKSFLSMLSSKTHKPEKSPKKFTVPAPPQTTYGHRSPSVFRPFESMMPTGKSKGKGKSSSHVSRSESKISRHNTHQVESQHTSQPVDKPFMPKTRDSTSDRRNSISDDDVLSSDTELPQPTLPQHATSHSSDVPAGTSSMHHNSISHPIPISSHSSSAIHNMPAYASPSDIVYSSSPASISGSTKPQSSPQSNSLYDFHSPTHSQAVHPLVNRLRRQAQTSLDCVNYMDFSSLISYANVLFAGMRQLESEREYENAYVHGYMAMIVALDVLHKHPDRQPKTGKDYFRYIELDEVINFRYKSMLSNIQRILENTYPNS